MTFEKRSAEFVGKVRVVLNDPQTREVELLCDGLTVHFSQDVTLDSSEEGNFEAVLDSEDEEKKAPVERLQCHNRVRVQIEQFEEGRSSQRHFAEFADLNVNLETGDFQAIGPGFLESISPDTEGRLQGAPPAAVRPNSPSQTRQLGFVYLRTEFVGEVTGNIDVRKATLSQNVVALMSPARHVDEKIDLQNTSAARLPERAGILQAETLTIGAIWDANGVTKSFSLDCRDNARLTSRQISASADVITYDHSKEQFIIRAEGGDLVTVNHRPGTTGQVYRTRGTRYEYYRKTNQLKADQIDGLDLN